MPPTTKKPKHNCRWVLADGTYCEKPVKYRVVPDDDQNPVRKYSTFCEEHQAKFDAQPKDEDLCDE